MKKTLSLCITSLVASLIFALILGGIYPLIVFGVGQLFFHKKANGSLIYNKDQTKVVGSSLIGQNFAANHYFHPRPSSAGKRGYDAANSSGSNLGPTSGALIENLETFSYAYRSQNGLDLHAIVPADAVTASGSGLDPHISLKNALLQLPRVATARGLSEERIKEVLHKYVEGSTFGLLGEKRVNIILLNLALDDISH